MHGLVLLNLRRHAPPLQTTSTSEKYGRLRHDPPWGPFLFVFSLLGVSPTVPCSKSVQSDLPHPSRCLFMPGALVLVCADSKFGHFV